MGLRDYLRLAGHLVNEKRLRRLVRRVGQEPIHPKPRVSVPRQDALRPIPTCCGTARQSPSLRCWCRQGSSLSTDINYVPMAKGFLYLVAMLDWHSRYALS